MRNRINSALLLTMALLLSSCGGGGATSGDPLGTDSIKVEASATSISAGQESVITATVERQNKLPATDRSVSFTFRTNNTGGTLRVVNDQVDGQGKAVAVYTAGPNSPLTDVQDTIQASLSNDAVAAVVITRSAGTAPTPTTDLSVSVAASPTSVSAGQTSILTATVTGESKAGAAVTFSLPVNSSGASFINASGASVSSITVSASGSGVATAIYKAGATSPSAAVQDTVQTVLTNSANGAVILTRTSTTTAVYAVSIDAPTRSVTAGQASIITATVTSGPTDPAAGVTVSFTLPVNSSGATLSSATATTDGNGKAVVIYQPGATSPTLSMQDTVQAAVGTATSAVAITRTGSSTLEYKIAVTAAPATLSLASMNSIVTATVTNNVGTAVSGVTVTFARDASSVVPGTVLPLTSITDSSGNAQTVYTGVGGVAKATGVVTASITISGNTYTAAVIITNP